MRIGLTCGAAITFAAAFLLTAAAQDHADKKADSEASLRQRRLELLLSRVDKFTLREAAPDGRALKRGERPILRWSNPVREFVNDGVTFLFLDGKRPQAVVTVWVRSREASLTSGEAWREFASFSAQPLVCQRDGRTLWSPKTGGLVDQPLDDVASPASRPARRLAQMREVARRFHATWYKMGSPNELRLLTQPLYRYQDADRGILDGALFAFVEGNDAEALLLVEATSGRDEQHSWRYSIARMTAYRVVVRLDEGAVFDVAPYWRAPRAPDDPYMEANDGPFAMSELEDDSQRDK